MKKMLFLGLSVIYMLILTFCEYTPDVIAHITDEENYITLETEAYGAQYGGEEYSYLHISLPDLEYYERFFGFIPADPDPDLTKDAVVDIKIMPEIASLLYERGFFDDLHPGDKITIRTTAWVNKSIEHHYLAAISIGDKEYLAFDEGFELVKDASVKIKDMNIQELLGKLK